MGRWTAAPCFALLVGCATSEEPVTLEVLTWWRDDSEAAAFSVLESSVPDHVRLTDPGSVNSTRTRSRLADNLFARKPPSSFQANLGADVLRWNQVEFADEKSGAPYPAPDYLEPLDRWFGPLSERFEPILIEDLRFDSHLYAIPINIHRLNLLYFNRANAEAFEKANGRPLTSLDVLCPEDQSGNPPFSVAVGRADQFMLVQLVFEALLPALHGREFYEQLFIAATPDGEWPKMMREVLSCYEYLARGFVGDADSRWGDAVKAVESGAADFTVTGDWATGKLGDSYPEVVGSVPFPNTDPLFIYTSDTFSLPIGAPHPEETLSFLSAVASARVQERFSAQKGSIPAFADADDANVGEFAVATRAEFRRTTPLLATSGVLPPYYPLRELSEALSGLVPNDEGKQRATIDDALRYIEGGQPLIEKWKNRKAEP